nr:VCBS repeat-containing protein [Allomuricauda sp.]
MKKEWCYILILVICLASCGKEPTTLFKKVPSSKSNIKFANILTDTPELNILNYLYYYNGAGVASGDFNNDGLLDLYFTGNQVNDQLYINKGNFQFENITGKARIQNSDGWTTGVTSVDINNDGLLDIYVCKVGNYGSLKGRNLLFVNQGVGANGIPTFKEEAKKYNLDFSGFSTHAAFFDFDLDGDLDMYLMNHSVYPNRAYGRGAQRKTVDSLSGDRLYENDKGTYIDVSTKAGIYQGKSGYGLGLSVSDINNDGFPDIYVGNDFFENDYLYLNQKDGTFKEIISSDDGKLGHTTHFSMGNDIADINNDGLSDIVSLDMLPENLMTYKTSGLEYSYPIYQQYLKNGYAPQYMQNTLHLNLGGANFAEIGNLSGIAATEWSWGALLADFDNDGLKDVFISNGIKGATNDMDFINFISNDNIQKRLSQGMEQSDMPLIEEIPVKHIPNYVFKNIGEAKFTDTTEEWLGLEDSFSNGSVYADLDNDGDLDLVVNNVDDEAYIMENTGNPGNYLSIHLDAGPQNRFGLGTKVISHSKSQVITQENYISKGYLSSIAPLMHIGLGKDTIVDSLQVIWPDGTFETHYNLSAPNNLRLKKGDAPLKQWKYVSNNPNTLFHQLNSVISYTHKETTSLDFDREPLIPFANSNEGPDISVGDINLDGLEDLFISGAKKQSSVLYVQNSKGGFDSAQNNLFAANAVNEDTSHAFFHANDDDFLDLIVVSGGNEYPEGKPLQPRLYINSNGHFELDTTLLPSMETNASKVITADFDKDGTDEIVIVSDQVPSQYGKTPEQFYLKQNEEGKYEALTQKFIPELQTIGNIKDVYSVDLDRNGYLDLIVVGHWMPISIFLNKGGIFSLQKNNGLEATHGWWNVVKTTDLDQDGDLDLVCGNWGLNSKLKASHSEPITLYINDFDANGSIEPVVTHYHKGTETPFASKDELVKQMPFLNKDFLSYADFAKASIEELFGADQLDKAQTKKVYELASCYFVNDGNGAFTKKRLPGLAQASVVQAMLPHDLTGNGKPELLIFGNNFEISTQLGRMDASHGLILQQDENENFTYLNNSGMEVSGAVRSIEKITIGNKTVFIVGRNNASPIFWAKK